jgi:sugar phosphate isomerase/epimerase
MTRDISGRSAFGLGRREFLGGSALALAALGSGMAAAAHHQDEHRKAKPGARVPGIQLYTLRESMQEDLPATLEGVAAIGYKEVECAGYFDVPPAKLRRMIEDLGMRSPNSHVGWEAMQKDPRSVIEPAAELGNEWVTLAWMPPEERETIDDWKGWADTCNQAGEIATSVGLRAAYHNHDFEFLPIDGTVPFDILLSETDPKLVDFELDFFWVKQAGRDIGEILAKAPDRFVMAHIKDMNAGGEMVDVGAGTIDFVSILGSPAGQKVRHLFVEHDSPQDAFRSAAVSYGALRSILMELHG